MGRRFHGAWLYGHTARTIIDWRINVQGKLTFLGGNFKATRPGGTMFRSAFPGMSDAIVSASLFYEKYGISALVSYPWRNRLLFFAPALETGVRMFIAMNRFQIIPGEEDAFERVWTSRDTYLNEVPGFVEFHLLRGPAQDDHTLFASHTVWRSREDFEAWTQSEAFRLAHRNAGDNKPLYLGHPRFEGFEVVQTVTSD